ncbi:MAG TPA: CBU_0585 family protein [Gammaproteobacteria bacterium]|nr:CBU_0585 family protein [Gammaproteobacteria bacterium]
MLEFLKRYFMPIYVSPLDQFLAHFDATHPPTPVQQREIDKYRRLYQSRDQSSAEENLLDPLSEGKN